MDFDSCPNEHAELLDSRDVIEWIEQLRGEVAEGPDPDALTLLQAELDDMLIRLEHGRHVRRALLRGGVAI